MNFQAWSQRVLVVDVEGNGTNPPDLVEIAALPVRDGQPDTSTAKAWLIRPERPVTARAVSIHGLTNELLADQPAWAELADSVHNFLGWDWICAHNAHVDYRELSRHLPKWEPAGVIDTLRLAKATYKGLPSYTLDALLKHVEPDLSQAPRVGRTARRTTPTPRRSSCSPWPATTGPGTSSSPRRFRPASPAPLNRKRSQHCGDRPHPPPSLPVGEVGTRCSPVAQKSPPSCYGGATQTRQRACADPLTRTRSSRSTRTTPRD